MKRKTGILIFGIISVLGGLLFFLHSCNKSGNVSHVERSLEESERYTKQDIETAMDIVENQFKVGFPGCTLTKLWYDESYSAEQEPEWGAQYEADEAIVLLSDFEVGSSGGDGSLNPNETYTDWKWILIRQKGGTWNLETWGY